MPGPDDVALDHYTQRRILSEAAAQVAAAAWGQVDPDDILRSWLGQLPALTTAVSGAQLAAAAAADGYTTDVLEAQGLDAAADGQVAARTFAGVASDGRSLATLLANPAVTALSAIKDGIDVARALAAGRSNLDMIVRTQVADSGRAADQAALVARPAATGYVRVAVGQTCARCLILAGRTYRWSAGFQRHPRCDCIHLPTQIATAGGLVQDPHEMYARLTPAERTRAGFTAADQAAIRDGADLNAVVNAHRGMYTTVVGGRTIRATREGTTVRGTFGGFEIDPDTGALRRRASSELENRRSGSRRIGAARAPRLTPEQIYRIAGDNRDEAVRLLRRNGYLIDRRVVRTVETPRVPAAVVPAHLNRQVRPLNELVDPMLAGQVRGAKFDAVADEIARGVRGTFGGLDVRDIEVTVDAGGAVHVAGIVYQERRQVGEFARAFWRDPDGKLVATHDYLSIARDVQGSGFQREFNGNLYDWYRRSGFDRVHVHADIDVGGYTWASSGFDWATAHTARETAEWASRRLARIAAAPGSFLPGLSEAEVRAQVAEMEELLTRILTGRFGSPDYPTAYEVSQLGRKPGMGRDDPWLGKLLMLGSDWNGVLRL